MTPARLNQIKKDLDYLSPDELRNLCLKLARFKTENKELLTYMLYYRQDEERYIAEVTDAMNASFSEVNTSSYYYIRKSVRKILKRLKTCIRYSKRPTTEIELLMAFCRALNTMEPSFEHNRTLRNTYQRQLDQIQKTIARLHEDLQYDYSIELEAILTKKR